MYYMTSQHWGLVILREKRLKLSTIPELNDPFELLGASIGEKNIRRILKILHAHWTKTKGMICFSDNWRSPLMWAHYADKHRGLCIGFDIVETGEPLLFPVRYEPTRLLTTLDYNSKTGLPTI